MPVITQTMILIRVSYFMPTASDPSLSDPRHVPVTGDIQTALWWRRTGLPSVPSTRHVQHGWSITLDPQTTSLTRSSAFIGCTTV